MHDSNAALPTIYPILYSFRRCPYAMRARLTIAVAGIRVALREIELRNKPRELLAVSPKGTVPVLLLKDGQVIDQSLDIMRWALAQNDSRHWLAGQTLEDARHLLEWNDGEFKYHLDRYKYPDRYPESAGLDSRRAGEKFLIELERRLTNTRYLCGPGFSLADAAILPFIRQFAAVDSAWFTDSPYPAVQQWLNDFLKSSLFDAVMQKYRPWNSGDQTIFFGDEAIPGPNIF